MLPIHKLATIFPPMSDAEYDALVLDIHKNGQHDPIWLYEGQIMDGRHRYQACLDNHIEPIIKEYEGDDPLGFVMSINLYRRHLNGDQKEAVYIRLRDIEGRRPVGRKSSQNVTDVTSVPTADDYGARLGVDRRTIQRYEQDAKVLDSNEAIKRQVIGGAITPKEGVKQIIGFTPKEEAPSEEEYVTVHIAMDVPVSVALKVQSLKYENIKHLIK